MVNDNVPHTCWLGKLSEEEGFQEPALPSKGLGTSPSPEMRVPTLGMLCGREALLYNQMHINKLKAPRSQALEKLTSFASLTCLDYGIPLS